MEKDVLCFSINETILNIKLTIINKKRNVINLIGDISYYKFYEVVVIDGFPLSSIVSLKLKKERSNISMKSSP